jgi:hypothetical protein
MPEETPTDQSRTGFGGTALLLVVSFATIVTVAAEAAFMHWATWAILPVIVLAIVAIAAGVVAAVGRLIDEGDVPANRTVHGH